MAAPGAAEPREEQQQQQREREQKRRREEPEPVSAEAVLRELRLFELRCHGEDVPGRLLELCQTHGLDPVTLANELLAFVTSKDLGTQLSCQGLDAFEQEVLVRRNNHRGPPRRDKRDPRGGVLHNLQSLQELLEEEEEEEEEEELLAAYSTPGKASQKRGNSSPETPRPKRSLSGRSPYSLLSPNSLSPGVTPSQKYCLRGGRGEVVASWGPPQGPSWSGRGASGAIPKLFGPPEGNLTKNYKFMFQNPLDVREALCWRMEELGAAVRSHHGLDDFGSCTIPAQEAVTVLGQIGCDSNGKLNPKSVILEGDREHSAGGRIPLDLSELQEYSLFPGQVVVLEGTNSTGRSMVVSKLYQGVPLPFHTPTEPQPAERRLVLVASGPYTPSDTLSYQPLTDLVQLIARDRPDLCILFGPFVDAKHPQVESCQLLGSFNDVFNLCLKTIVEGTRSAGSQLVLVPSPRDVSHPPVYPQPPFSCPHLPREDRQRVHLVPDPCTLELDGVVFGLTATDLLLQLGAEEISSSQGLSDRFSRILSHILTQRSYYPLYPPSEELNVDYGSFPGYTSFPVTPDVLVTPSELRYFLKEVLGCVCINPGRLTKGQAGGTYGRLYVQREEGEGTGSGRKNPCVAAQILKI